MKSYILLFVFTICSLSIYAQVDEVKIGSVLKIGEPATKNYKHINFPKANIIAKRGGIANYEILKNSLVVINSVSETKEGITVIKIKRKDGKRFFGSHNYISAYYKSAIASGELNVQ